jgi:hypothetical protein
LCPAQSDQKIFRSLTQNPSNAEFFVRHGVQVHQDILLHRNCERQEHADVLAKQLQSGKMQDSCWSSAMVQEQVGVGRVFTQCTFIELFSGKTFSFLHSSIPEFSKFCSLRSHLHSTQQACFNRVPLNESTMLHGLYHTFQQCQDERVDSQRVARVKRVDMRAGGCWRSHLQARNRLPPIQMAYNSRVHCAHLTNTSFSFTCIIYLCFDAEAGFHRATCTPHTSQCRPQTGAEGFFLHAIEDGDGEVSCTRATALLALHALRSAAVLQLFSSS